MSKQSEKFKIKINDDNEKVVNETTDIKEENKNAKDASNDTQNAKIEEENEEATEDLKNSKNESCKKDEEQQKQKLDNAELDKIKAQLNEKDEKCLEYMNRLQRVAAEFDNYKKRTSKEKECIYDNARVDTVASFLPVVDNLERAIGTIKDSDDKGFVEGVKLVYKQLIDALDNIGISPIEAVGKEFNPEYHNAVMHIEDENYGENEIVEEFQKGYIYKQEIVVRHSMVKVAN